MKKLNKIITLLILISLFVSCALPINTKAKTMSEYQADVEKTIKELQEKKDKLAKNAQEIAKIKENISSIESQIKDTENQINSLQKEIDDSNKKIEEKSDESKRIIEYYQVANGNNAYLEYAFGATDITDLIYRMSVVEQLTEYNNKIMEELQQLIEENDAKKEKLSAKKKELASLKSQLESEKEKIEADSANIQAGMPSLEQQLKSAQDSLKTLKNMNCRSNEDIIACRNRIYNSNKGGGSQGGGASVPSANGVFRPTTYGRINQAYSGCGYYNPYKKVCTGHIGVDIGSYGKEIPIYPIADGVISSIYKDPAGALVVRVKHRIKGEILYSTYAHLSRYASGIYTGMEVTTETRLGDMGTTGNSTGIHLHMELSVCDWNSQLKGDWKCSWQYYAESSTKNPANYVTIPYTWNNR